jgi:C4-dicarboxylate-specific signal transduction histidine kinase
MSEAFGVPGLSWLIQAYFSDPARRRTLRKDEFLLEQGLRNDRLYLIVRGSFGGYVRKARDSQYELFEATRNMFVGVQSFFSRTYVSMATVVAREESEVAWIDEHQAVVGDEEHRSMSEQFMPVVVANLSWRHRREQELAVENAEVLKRLARSERLASLGQMAAGIAHELNNAVAVLARDAEWLRNWASRTFEAAGDPYLKDFDLGWTRGRVFSSREVRERARCLIREAGLSEEDAARAAEMGPEADISGKGPGSRPRDLRAAHERWEIGATFHDMAAAAELASHVVGSVKAMASQGSAREPGVDVNGTIREALTLLQSPLRKVRVDLDLEPLPPVAANKSELVQVWTNLVMNAAESLESTARDDGRIAVESRATAAGIEVRVRDDGPGIPAANMPRLFQPDFTTKEKGLDFGLGLGLPIVERIVHSYGGAVRVESRPGDTVFAIQLPSRGERG